MNDLSTDTTVVESLLWIPGALLYLPAGIIAATVVLACAGGAHPHREQEKSVLALLVLAIVTTFLAANVGFVVSLLLGEWSNLPFQRIIPGYLLGGSLVCAWLFKYRAYRCSLKEAELQGKGLSRHRSGASRTWNGAFHFALLVSVLLVPLSLFYRTNFGIRPDFMVLVPPPGTEPDPITADPSSPTTPSVTASAPSVPAAAAAAGSMAAQPDPGSRKAMANPEQKPPPDEPSGEPQPQPLPDMAGVSKLPADVDPESAYATQVAPILERTCYKCHDVEEVKGELRIDTPDWIRTG
ncbi:MAG: hypothetical protein ACC661_09585, partial [Verrucomicrobiales bacterium]